MPVRSSYQSSESRLPSGRPPSASLKRPSRLISFTDHDDEARRHRCWTATLFRSSAADIMRIMLGVGVYLPIIACPLPGRTLAVHEGDT